MGDPILNYPITIVGKSPANCSKADGGLLSPIWISHKCSTRSVGRMATVSIKQC